MTVYHTADLGWTTGQTGAQTRSLLSSIFNTMSSGDELVLDDLYVFAGNAVSMKAGTTLSAAYGGGFNDTMPSGNQNLLNLAANCTVRNVTFKSLGPDGSTFHYGVGDDHGPVSGVDVSHRKCLNLGSSANDCVIEYCDFDGNFANSIVVSGAKRGTVYRCRLWRGRYQMMWSGAVHDWVVEECLFDQAMQDGLKTAKSGTQGTQRATVRGCIFQDSFRDGIDTGHGGFKDSLIYQCEFRRNANNIDGGGALDLKTIAETGDTPAEGYSVNALNKNILIEECLFQDCRFMAILTMIDRIGPIASANPASPYYAPLWCPQDIRFVNCIAEKSTEPGSKGTAMVRLKGAHTVTVTNLERRNAATGGFSLSTPNTLPTAVQAILNYGAAATYAANGSPGPAHTDVPGYIGPQDNTPGQKVPDVDAKAIAIDAATGVLAINTNVTGILSRLEVSVRAINATGADHGMLTIAVQKSE